MMNYYEGANYQEIDLSAPGLLLPQSFLSLNLNLNLNLDLNLNLNLNLNLYLSLNFSQNSRQATGERRAING